MKDVGTVSSEALPVTMVETDSLYFPFEIHNGRNVLAPSHKAYVLALTEQRP